MVLARFLGSLDRLVMGFWGGRLFVVLLVFVCRLKWQRKTERFGCFLLEKGGGFGLMFAAGVAAVLMWFPAVIWCCCCRLFAGKRKGF